MESKSRVRNLSTRYLSLYRHGIALIIFGLAASFLWSAILEFASGDYLSFVMPAYWGYFLYLWYRVNKRVFHVEFDDEFLYVRLKASDLIIPSLHCCIRSITKRRRPWSTYYGKTSIRPNKSARLSPEVHCTVSPGTFAGGAAPSYLTIRHRLLS